MESLSSTLIMIHAGFGGIALLTGFIALSVKKGGYIHRISGKLFFYSMLSSAILALIISALPDHQSLFLFVIGLFSTYLILTGYKALSYKRLRSVSSLLYSKIISYTMLVVAIIMMFIAILPVFRGGAVHIVLVTFGSLALFLSLRDIKLISDTRMLRKKWLTLHIGNMVGGYIAACTAFIVVNQIIPGIYGWLLPTVVGTLYITYWMLKISPNRKP
jgi:uncharacterized membrane protein